MGVLAYSRSAKTGMKMQKRKAAIIGTGAIAREHLLVLRNAAKVDVVAVCDLSPARAEMTAERFSVAKHYSNHQTMLDENKPDLVHICTPPQTHFGLSKYCLERGLNVLCEKPITQDYAQFVELKTLASKYGAAIYENQNYRTHSSVTAIKSMVDRDELGDIVEVQVQVHLGVHGKGSVFVDNNVSHYSATQRGGIVGDFITHMTYLAQMFMGGKAEAHVIEAGFNSSAPQPDDEFRALLKGERALGLLSFSGNAQPNGFWLRVLGTKGQVEANLFEPPRIVRRMQRGGALPIATMKDGFAEARDVFKSAYEPFWRKLAGTSRYDGLSDYLHGIYEAMDGKAENPLTITQLDDCCSMIEKLFAGSAKA
jgi:predicted dehydrogenase